MPAGQTNHSMPQLWLSVKWLDEINYLFGAASRKAVCAAGKSQRACLECSRYHRNKGIARVIVLSLFVAILILIIFVTFLDNMRKEGKSGAIVVATADVVIELHCERYQEDEQYVDSMYGCEQMDEVSLSNSTSATKIKKLNSTKVILSLLKLECFSARKAPQREVTSYF